MSNETEVRGRPVIFPGWDVNHPGYVFAPGDRVEFDGVPERWDSLRGKRQLIDGSVVRNSRANRGRR